MAQYALLSDLGPSVVHPLSVLCYQQSAIVVTRILRQGGGHSVHVDERRQKSQKFVHKYNKLALSQLK